jgi:MtN3 and saliva related transmembrane protein
MIDLASFIALVAGTLTTLSFLPQVRRSLSDREHLHAISGTWLIGFGVGVFLWTTFGFLMMSLPIILANGVTLALVARIGLEKVRVGMEKRTGDDLAID